MEKEQATPSSSGLYGGGGERGAGGKFRKPPARRPPTTPYARPPAKQSQLATPQGRDGGWLSKLVDPACRLLSGGAIRILPSFFSKSPSIAAPTTEDNDDEGTDLGETASGHNPGCISDLGVSESTGGSNPMERVGTLNGNSDVGQLGKDKLSNLHDGSEFSRIEQLIKGRTFSRDEIIRLTEIINSRAPGTSSIEPESKIQKMTISREDKGAAFAREYPRMSSQEKQEGLGAGVGTLTPLLRQSAVKDDVGASPVDIARAYMGSRVSEVDADFKRIISKDETVLPQSDGFASGPLFPSPSPKPSMCWPGAMVQDQHGLSTPRSAGSRYGLHYFQRTPYSRTIYSKSNSRLTSQADNNRYLNAPSTSRLHPQTPLYGQSKGDDLRSGSGTVGPIRRIRRKFLSEAPLRGSITVQTSQKGFSEEENFKGVLPTWKKNLEVGASSTSGLQSADNTTNSSLAGSQTLQSSNPAVRAILEHLDRNKPSPKEKSAELQLATAWKKCSSSKVIDANLKDGTTLLDLESSKDTNFVYKELSAQGNGRGMSNFEVKLQEKSTSEATAVSKDIEPSSMVGRSNASQIKFPTETATVGFTDGIKTGGNGLWSTWNQNNGKDVANAVSEAPSVSLKKPPSHPQGPKPVLASISVNKPDLRQTFFSDNNSGFSFPVSTSSGALSEPPTPSVMPSTLASGPSRLNDESAIPSYSFGTKRSTPALVFAFPSANTASFQTEASDIKFSFGSERKNRISFSSVGKDPICY